MAGQTKRQSLVESLCNTAIGFIGSCVLAKLVFPLFGWETSWTAAALTTAIFTAWSIVRGYYVRRLFNSFGTRCPNCPTRWLWRQKCVCRQISGDLTPKGTRTGP